MQSRFLKFEKENGELLFEALEIRFFKYPGCSISSVCIGIINNFFSIPLSQRSLCSLRFFNPYSGLGLRVIKL